MTDPQQQRSEPRVSGIAAAALEGAREGEEQNVLKNDPDANAEAMARPAPGMTEQQQSNADRPTSPSSP